jgi:hypothetical protein
VTLFVDADGCPVKDEVVRVALRWSLPTVFVSNRTVRIPEGPLLSAVVVGSGFDSADDWIVARVAAGDIVVTSDIPLAARCIERGAQVVPPDGRELSEANIGEAVAGRELSSYLRESGLQTGGPPPFSAKCRSLFLHRIQEVIQVLRRREERPRQQGGRPSAGTPGPF